MIDDVSTQVQKDKILAMGYKINMAFYHQQVVIQNLQELLKILLISYIHFLCKHPTAFKGTEINTLM